MCVGGGVMRRGTCPEDAVCLGGGGDEVRDVPGGCRVFGVGVMR